MKQQQEKLAKQMQDLKQSKAIAIASEEERVYSKFEDVNAEQYENTNQ